MLGISLPPPSISAVSRLSCHMTRQDTPTLEEVLDDQYWFPHRLLPGRVLQFVKCTPESFTDSAFLDSRIKHLEDGQFVINVDNFNARVEEPGERLCHIFHIGHVGSTLAARMLGEIERFRVLREPEILQDVTSNFDGLVGRTSQLLLGELQELTGKLRTLLVRGPQEKTIIKHTSRNNSAADFLIGGRKSPCVFLYTTLERHLAHFAESDSAKRDMLRYTPERIQYFNKIASVSKLNLARQGLYRMAALNWLTEMQKMIQLREKYPDITFVDFDVSMRDRSQFISAISDGLGLDLTDEESQKLQESSIWNTGSKTGKPFDYSKRSAAIERHLRDGAGTIAESKQFVRRLCELNLSFYPAIHYLDASQS